MYIYIYIYNIWMKPWGINIIFRKSLPNIPVCVEGTVDIARRCGIEILAQIEAGRARNNVHDAVVTTLLGRNPASALVGVMVAPHSEVYPGLKQQGFDAGP